jgi:hypothetical protein
VPSSSAVVAAGAWRHVAAAPWQPSTRSGLRQWDFGGVERVGATLDWTWWPPRCIGCRV